MDHPIQVESLRKNYGDVAALKGIDFEVRVGEVFGLLGPNGAGKTTTVEILEGLRSRSSGRVTVLGCDPEVQTNKLKDRIGVCLQATKLQDKIKVREAMELFAAFYTRTVDSAQLLKRLQAAYHPPHHALHRGGRAALRPRGHRGRGPHYRYGHAA